MAYLRNKTVNRLNLHYGMHTLAMSGDGGGLEHVRRKWRPVPPPDVL